MSSHDRPSGSDRDRRFSAARRNVLLSMAATGVGLASGEINAKPAAAEAGSAAPSAAAPLIVPFHGPHQAGVTTPPPSAALVAAFDVLVETADELATCFSDLTNLCRLIAEGGTPPRDDDKFPAFDNGVLGPELKPERSTVTLAVGASLFDERFGLASLKPKQLVDMEAFPNDALVDDLCHGDLLLQFCAESPEEVIHGLRLVIKAMPDQLALKWKQEGFTPSHGTRRGPVGTGRNLFGFKDGTANADINDAALMNDYVWVQPGTDEPAWTVGGTYQVVRLIRNYVEFWDRTPLGEQERIFGRKKDSGAPLGSVGEFDSPEYATDPKGEKVPLDAHIRLANPRTPEATPRLIRRGFNYSNGLTNAGQLDMGLLFVSFQSDLSRGFLAAQTRLNGEPLEEYIKPFGGGYFFVLPGVTGPDDVFGRELFQAVAAHRAKTPSDPSASAHQPRG